MGARHTSAMAERRCGGIVRGMDEVSAPVGGRQAQEEDLRAVAARMEAQADRLAKEVADRVNEQIPEFG